MSRSFERSLRLGLWWLLILGWIPAVWLMFDSLATLPSADGLEDTRLTAIPTVRMFVAAVVFSGLELALVLALLWPWRSELYATRLAAAVLALVTWFLMTTAMDLNRMDWVHRRWLAGMIIGLGGALLILLGARAARRLRSTREES